jgi:MoaA/NifB/PqqE/SkfB family radical SAM enzyme
MESNVAASDHAALDWQGAADPVRYAALVRSAFGSGGASNEDVARHLLPAMTGLECAQIEITTWCNFACQQCSRTTHMALGTWKNEHVPLERCRNIIDKLPRTRAIYLQGIGEPSMHPDFVEILELSASSGKFDSIHFNTNGHTHDDAWWRGLARFPGITPGLSVDSLDPVLAEICRSGTKADLLWERIKLFRETFTWFIVAMVASRLNLEDIDATLRKIATCPNVPVQITRMMSDDESVVLRPEDEVTLARIVERVRKDHPEFSVYFNANSAEVSTDEKRCVSPFVTPFIRADGFLTPCCAATGASHYGYTRVDGDRTWDEIRNDPRVMGWIRSFIEADPEVCQGCSLNPNQTNLLKKASKDP